LVYQELRQQRVCIAKLKERLLEAGFVRPNESHLDKLVKLCQKANIPFHPDAAQPSNANQAEEEEKKKLTPAFAFLQKLDVVRITEVFNPDHFYVVKAQFSKQLESLEAELTKLWSSKGEKLKSTLALSHYCCVRHDSFDEVRRGQIVAIDEATNTYKVFFLDSGITVTDVPDEALKNLPIDFIRRLPFQAIECCLEYVLPLSEDEEGWSKEAGDFLWNLAKDEDEPNEFSVSVHQKLDSDGPCYYRISLCSLKKNAFAATELVEANLARYKEGYRPIGIRALNESALEDQSVSEKELQTGPPRRKSPFDEAVAFSETTPNTKESSGTYVNIGIAKSAASKDYSLGGELAKDEKHWLQKKRDKQQEQQQQQEQQEQKKGDQNKGRKPVVVTRLATPPDMPKLDFVDGVTNCNKGLRAPSQVRWSQDKHKLTLHIKLDLSFDLLEEDSYVHIATNSLSFSYVEALLVNKVETFHAYQLPDNTFFGRVVPSDAKVTFGKRSVTIKLCKVVQVNWRYLFVDKSGQLMSFFFIYHTFCY
jgi:hypothetical protein